MIELTYLQALIVYACLGCLINLFALVFSSKSLHMAVVLISFVIMAIAWPVVFVFLLANSED